MHRPLTGDDAPIIRGKWPIVFVVLFFISVLAYTAYAIHAEPRGGTIPGMTFGILSFLLMVFLMAYKLRKHMYFYKLGSADTWLTAHLYLGVLTAILVVMHIGGGAGGVFGSFLLGVFSLVIASGVAGALIFRIVPLSLAKDGKELLPREQMLESLKKQVEETDRDAAKMSPEFQRLYRSRIRKKFKYTRVMWEYLFTEEHALTKKRIREMELLKHKVPDGEKFHFSLLTSLLLDRERMVFRLAKMELLDKWLAVHLPLSGLALTGVVIHIFLVIYY